MKSAIMVTAVVSLVICAGLAGAGGAGEKDPEGWSRAEQTSLYVDSLVGKPVANMSGAKLGKVSDVVVDKLTNEVAYLVVKSGGFLGFGGQERVIPFHAVNMDYQGKMKVSMDSERFQEAPARPQDLADRQWGRRVHEFYGVAPYWEEEWIPPLEEMNGEDFDQPLE